MLRPTAHQAIPSSEQMDASRNHPACPKSRSARRFRHLRPGRLKTLLRDMGMQAKADLVLGSRVPKVEPVSRDLPRATPVFEDVFREFRTDVLKYALVLTGNGWDAEDITAETFFRAWIAWEGGRGPTGSVLPWLITIARNQAFDRWRRLRRAMRGLPKDSPLVGHDEAEARAWLASVCKVLPPRQREAVVLRYDQDLSDAEIGGIMGLSESGVRSLVARAIATLRGHPEVWR